MAEGATKGAGNFEIVVDPGALTCRVRVFPGGGGEGPPPPLSLEELARALSARGITWGIDWDAVRQAAAATGEEEVVVARGKPPSPGEDARVEVLFPEEERIEVLPEGSEAVDFRERFRLVTVSPGAVLARLHPACPGTPGTDVYGRPVPPPRVRELKLLAGRGVELAEGGLEAVAAAGGRPVAVRRRGMVRVDVLPSLTHLGDVDMASGNIVFDGDAHILGDVREGMRVSVGGRLTVAGSVDRAVVSAAASSRLGNAIGSSVVVGGEKAAARALLPIAEKLHQKLSDLSLALSQLEKAHAAIGQGELFSRSIGAALRLLLEGRFSAIPALVGEFRDAAARVASALKGSRLEAKLAALADGLERALVTMPMQVAGKGELDRLVGLLGDLIADLLASQGSRADLEVAYAIHSRLIASGAVKVSGAGCYNSTVQAGGEVHVSGVFRGGEIQAGGDVYVGELGSPAGSPTLVRTVPKSSVTLGLAWENAEVWLGPKRYRFSVSERQVKLYLNREGIVDKVTRPGPRR
ncbi:MAG: DUF342 domain-containing protein [Clostridia bacterium]|nr:DUF342 domain-containing protein [Clostridia bacterium]